MDINGTLPAVIDWSKIPPVTERGERGSAATKVSLHNGIRIRHIEFSDDYYADHWCEKGHIIQIISGTLIIDYQNEPSVLVHAGMTLILGKSGAPHRVRTDEAATVLIID